MRIMAFPLSLLALAACDANPTGASYSTLRVTVATTGGDIDDNGYVLQVGKERRSIGVNGRVALDGFRQGGQIVELTGVADNCTVAGTNPREVTVERGVDATTSFEVSCDATGIEVEVTTESEEQPFFNYSITAAARTELFPPNGVAAISRLSPGKHVLFIDTPINCTVAGAQTIPVEVFYRQVTRLEIEVSCEPPKDLIAFTMDSIAGNDIRRWIAITNADGIRPIALARGFDPVWSPVRDKLIWSTTECDYYFGLGCSGGLSVKDLKSGSLDSPENLRRGVGPALSSDGELIAFTRLIEYNSGVLQIGQLNGSISDLNPPVIDAYAPGFSPDGQQVVFQCTVNVAVFDVCIVNRDGSGFAMLTKSPVSETAPAWSPDGNRIAMVVGSATTHVIATMKPDGSDLKLLGPGFDPAWSPDGSKIVFAGSDGLFVMNADGSSVRRVTTGRHRDPTWRQ